MQVLISYDNVENLVDRMFKGIILDIALGYNSIYTDSIRISSC